MQRVKERIRVAAIFAPGSKIKPVWFEWRRQKHTVKELSYFWKDHVGDETRLHFAVTDGINLFELVYNAFDQSWNLEGIEGEQ
jgi:hypothetical protein